MWYLLLLPACLALHTFEPPPPVTISSRSTRFDFVDIRLNHFDASNTETFPMRYIYNGEYASPNTPIVIFVGGEWAISAGWVEGGLAYELASVLRSGLFYTEHRFYGQTRPSADTEVSNLRWLTVDQALADLAQFIQYVKTDFEQGMFRNSKVILVGCSYAGSMATWMRLAYPHLVDAAFSDSGPLHAQEDFPEYLEMITEALRVQGSEGCVTSIRTAMEAVVDLMESSPETVSTLFNTCTPFDASSQLDRATFFWFGITETFAYLVQYATPGDIAEACGVLTNPSEGDPVRRLATWITSQPWTQPCIESRYNEVVARHRNTSFDHPAAVMRLWTYQTCVEFGWYQTTSGTDQPFLTAVPLEYFHQMCRDFFSSVFSEDFLRSGISRTNLLFGGWSHLADHVVSVAGGHDPWAPVGPNASHATPRAPVYVVPQVSHCRAIRPLEYAETAELRAAQEAVMNHLSMWTTGQPLTEKDGAQTAVVSTTLLLIAMLIVL